MREALFAKLVPVVATLEIACDVLRGPLAKIESHSSLRPRRTDRTNPNVTAWAILRPCPGMPDA
jgi:hypothetical protein